MKTTLMDLSVRKKTLLLIAAGITLMSCQKEEDTTIRPRHLLTSVTGNEVSMNGTWSSGCVEANNGFILNETLSFNNESLEIEIKESDNLQCDGPALFVETIAISFSQSGTTTVIFKGKTVVVNTIDGTATYMDGSVEKFKQTFLVDDSGAEMIMHHALFENDGGQTNEDGYPIELIPIVISKQ